jgi:hypothetical protein
MPHLCNAVVQVWLTRVDFIPDKNASRTRNAKFSFEKLAPTTILPFYIRRLSAAILGFAA